MSNRPTFKSFSVLASAARTATTTPVEFYNTEHTGLLVVVRVTAGAATPSVVASVEGYDPTIGIWFQLHENITAITSTSAATYTYLIAPNVEETEGTGGLTMIHNGRLVRRMRITMTHADADSLTYSVAATLLP